jgi:hypothetical protein
METNGCVNQADAYNELQLNEVANIFSIAV